jgi:hypothetical protein
VFLNEVNSGKIWQQLFFLEVRTQADDFVQTEVLAAAIGELTRLSHQRKAELNYVPPTQE